MLAEHIELLGVYRALWGRLCWAVTFSQYNLDESTISRSDDVCSGRSWVLYDMRNSGSPSNVAHIYKTITSKDAGTSFVILEPWGVSAQRDEHYGMATLHRNPNQDIYFIFNAQHDRMTGKCQFVETNALQDRE
ncbi:hypothetical protein BDM02DRAFT_3190817 [Thelephora ganbajun]|uniref:Uncharacterized protein n=1 Tax=Thelephora ganbajun TaxID=370292 RepID=A0ACB6Z3B0_THEGA|nr:hypothetical protein BDM02DRAFT_3190817 [Thelephora ganbajun]